MRNLLALLLVCFLFAAPVRADMLGAMFPGAKNLPAPEWIKPGTRITWYIIDGTRYNNPQKKGAAGHGYREVFVVAMEPGKVVLELRFYLLGVQPTGPAGLKTVTGGVVTTPGAVQNCWVHPTAIEQILKKPPPETKVALHKVEFQGKQREAVLVSYSKDGSTFMWDLDRKTGLILSRSEKHEKKGFGGSVMSASGSLRDVATVKLPWAGQSNPGWLKNVTEIRFQGQQRSPAAPNIAVPLAMRIRKKAVGKKWALFEITQGSGMNQAQADAALDAMTTTKTPVVCGAACPAGVWIDATALARLQKGQVIMRNPITGADVTVFFVGMDRGQDICVLRWGNRLGYFDYVYDKKTGGLVRAAAQDDLTRRDFTMVGTR